VNYKDRMPAVDQATAPKRQHWRTTLKRLGACGDARTWCKEQPSIATAWSNCKRGDWLLWVAARVITNPVERMLVVLAACDCAEKALVHVPTGEDRPRQCIETVRAWTRGEATIEQVREGRRDDAAYAAAAAAAYAAADAAYAAYAAADDGFQGRARRPPHCGFTTREQSAYHEGFDTGRDARNAPERWDRNT
jgi:hypothetical protein